MSKSNTIRRKSMALTRDELHEFYIEDPIGQPIGRELKGIMLRYFYLDSAVMLETVRREALNGCLLSGNAILEYHNSKYDLNQFDMFFIPSGKESRIVPKSEKSSRLCLVFSPSEREVDADFCVQRFSTDNFTTRGEKASERRMSTYRTVWTAIKNGFFMSGFTNIPNESLRQGVLTSVNLENDKEGNPEIHPHIHPEIPEVYIYCLPDKSTAVTQYLIDPKGTSVCRDLTDGEGVFFPGHLGHSNFVRPNYKNHSHCMYMWIMSTYGRTDCVEPVTLKL